MSSFCEISNPVKANSNLFKENISKCTSEWKPWTFLFFSHFILTGARSPNTFKIIQNRCLP